MWCHDPDGAFDARCGNLGSEDWCKDNSNCPISREDQKMFITVDKNITTGILHEHPVVIQIHKDKKRFSVIKHDNFKPAEGKEYHISELKHILLAGAK